MCAPFDRSGTDADLDAVEAAKPTKATAPKNKPPEAMVALVPAFEGIWKYELLEKARVTGFSKEKVRLCLQGLIECGQLYEVKLERPRTSDGTKIARHATLEDF